MPQPHPAAYRLVEALKGPGGRYLAVGVLNTAVQLGLFQLALLLGQGLMAALVFSWAIAIAHSYAWNRRWTFRSQGAVARQLPRFLAVTFFCMGLNAVMLRALVGLGLRPLSAQVLCLGVTTAVGYLAQRLWTFRG